MIDSGEPYRGFVRQLYRKRELSRVGNSVGGMMLISMFLMYLVNLVAGVAFFLSGHEALLDDGGVGLVMQISFSALVLLVPALLLPVFSGDRLGDVFPAGRVSGGELAPLLLTGLGVAALANVGNSIFASLLSSFGAEPVGSSLPMPGGFWGVALTFLSGAVAPALMEEFAMRGALLGVVNRHAGPRTAVFVSSLVFGLMHGNLVQIPFAFLLGLYLGYMTVRTGSILPAVLLHFLNNFLSYIMDYITAGLGPRAAGIASLLYFVVLLAVGLVGVILLLGRRSYPLELPESEDKSLGAVCSAPLMIVYYVVVGFEVVLTQIGVY